MDKVELRKVITSLVLAILSIIICVVGIVIVNNSGIAEIQLGNSAAYTDFLGAYRFAFPSDGRKHLFFVLAGMAAVYIGALMLLLGIGNVIVKRSFRFFFLPIAGFCSFEVASFLGISFYHCQWGAAAASGSSLAIPLLVLCIALGLLGLGCFILAFIFPKRLLASKSDEEPVPEADAVLAKEEEKPVAQEPKETEPAPEEVSQQEDEPKEKELEQPQPEEPQPEVPQQNEPENKVEEKDMKQPVKNAAPAKKSAPEKAAAKAPAAAKKAPAKAEAKPKTFGKYEVFPEAGFFKYRLKANNGEILIVSNPYKSKESALTGIDTLKKNIPMGNAKIITDKNNFGQFRIFTGNDSRLIAAGEIYPNASGAEKALASVMNFYETDRVAVLDEIPEDEHREWTLFADTLTPSANGKITLEANADKFQARLQANNGALLFITSTYSSKTALKKALDNIKDKLLEGKNLTISKDKQDRYQFRVYSDNGILLLMGETYPSRDSAESAARSARNFIGDAKVIE